jgi:hypothetical protein
VSRGQRPRSAALPFVLEVFLVGLDLGVSGQSFAVLGGWPPGHEFALVGGGRGLRNIPRSCPTPGTGGGSGRGVLLSGARGCRRRRGAGVSTAAGRRLSTARDGGTGTGHRPVPGPRRSREPAFTLAVRAISTRETSSTGASVVRAVHTAAPGHRDTRSHAVDGKRFDLGDLRGPASHTRKRGEQCCYSRVERLG